MNTILNGAQSNTRKGDINLPASVDLTGKENLLWKVVNTAGAANFALPTAITDYATYIGMSGDVIGNNCSGEVPSSSENARVLLDGACAPGDLLTLSPNKWGRLYKPAGGSGATVAWFIAEETGVDGQLVLVRKVGPVAFTP
jgi:hypothetical protein